jgi:hypothetical protein
MRIGILLRSMVAFLANTSIVPGAAPVRIFLIPPPRSTSVYDAPIQ